MPFLQPVSATMTHADVTVVLAPAAPLVTANATCPDKVPPALCSTFELQARSDLSWHQAAGKIAGMAVSVGGAVPITEATKSNPVSGVRYGYSTWPVLPLYTNDGMPVFPFILEV